MSMILSFSGREVIEARSGDSLAQLISGSSWGLEEPFQGYRAELGARLNAKATDTTVARADGNYP